MITEILLTAIAVILFINLIFRIFKFKSKWEEIKHAHSKTENISLEFLMEFYKNIFLKNNFKCKNLYIEPRELHNDNLYLYHFCFKLEKIS